MKWLLLVVAALALVSSASAKEDAEILGAMVDLSELQQLSQLAPQEVTPTSTPKLPTDNVPEPAEAAKGMALPTVLLEQKDSETQAMQTQEAQQIVEEGKPPRVVQPQLNPTLPETPQQINAEDEVEQAALEVQAALKESEMQGSTDQIPDGDVALETGSLMEQQQEIDSQSDVFVRIAKDKANLHSRRKELEKEGATIRKLEATQEKLKKLIQANEMIYQKDLAGVKNSNEQLVKDLKLYQENLLKGFSEVEKESEEIQSIGKEKAHHAQAQEEDISDDEEESADQESEFEKLMLRKQKEQEKEIMELRAAHERDEKAKHKLSEKLSKQKKVVSERKLQKASEKEEKQDQEEEEENNAKPDAEDLKIMRLMRSSDSLLSDVSDVDAKGDEPAEPAKDEEPAMFHAVKNKYKSLDDGDKKESKVRKDETARRTRFKERFGKVAPTSLSPDPSEAQIETGKFQRSSIADI